MYLLPTTYVERTARDAYVLASEIWALANSYSRKTRDTNLRTVLSNHNQLIFGSFVLFLLFDVRYYSPTGSSGTYHILVCYGQQISLLDRQFDV